MNIETQNDFINRGASALLDVIVKSAPHNWRGVADMADQVADRLPPVDGAENIAALSDEEQFDVLKLLSFSKICRDLKIGAASVVASGSFETPRQTGEAVATAYMRGHLINSFVLAAKAVVQPERQFARDITDAYVYCLSEADDVHARISGMSVFKDDKPETLLDSIDAASMIHATRVELKRHAIHTAKASGDDGIGAYDYALSRFVVDVLNCQKRRWRQHLSHPKQ